MNSAAKDYKILIHFGSFSTFFENVFLEKKKFFWEKFENKMVKIFTIYKWRAV
jgi:hypothetical protein